MKNIKMLLSTGVILAITLFLPVQILAGQRNPYENPELTTKQISFLDDHRKDVESLKNRTFDAWKDARDLNTKAFYAKKIEGYDRVLNAIHKISYGVPYEKYTDDQIRELTKL